MTELEKIAYAKSFIDKLANGINPIDDTPVPERDIVNNVRLSRCFFYVSDILSQVIDNGGTQPQAQKKARKAEFSLSPQMRSRLLVSSENLTVTEIAENINSLIDKNKMKKITGAAINNWLLNAGYLEIVRLSNGKERKGPTEKGNRAGIFVDGRNGQFGDYYVVIFTPEAQQLVYDNLDAIVRGSSSSR